MEALNTFTIEVDSNFHQTNLKDDAYDLFVFTYELKSFLRLAIMRKVHNPQHQASLATTYQTLALMDFKDLATIKDLIQANLYDEEIGDVELLAFIETFAVSVLEGDISWFKQGKSMRFTDGALTVDGLRYEFVTADDAEDYLVKNRLMKGQGYCKECGEMGHRCLEKLPDCCYYDAFGATVSDEPHNPNNLNADIYNYCGGEPMALPHHKWPICPKHGPLLFLWQMRDQKTYQTTPSVEGMIGDVIDPCLIQMFGCGTWYKYPHGHKYHFSANLRCYEGEYLEGDDCNVHFDVASYKNFGYLTRRFYPLSNMKYLQRPTDREVIRTSSGKDDRFRTIKIAKRKEPMTEAEINHPENQEKELIIPKKYLHWQRIRMPYTREQIDARFKGWEPNPRNFTFFGNDEVGVPLVMHSDGIYEGLSEAGNVLNEYTLVHHILGYHEQSPVPEEYGYIYMIQEAGYLGVMYHGNPAGGVGINYDLVAQFVL